MTVSELVERLRSEGFAEDQYWIGSDRSWADRYECLGLRYWDPDWELFYAERGVVRTLDRFGNEEDAVAGLYRALSQDGPRRRCVAFLNDEDRANSLLDTLLCAGIHARMQSVQHLPGANGVRYHVSVHGPEFAQAKALRDQLGSGWLPADWADAG